MLEAITRFREHLKAGRVCLGTVITLTDPIVTDAMAAALDFIWIDLEHSAMSPEAMRGHLLAARARNVAALVRVPASGTAFIKPVLDSGAEGIIVPQVANAAEVRQVVDDCRYPPQGRRGYGARIPADYGRERGAAYAARANRDIFVAVMVESVEALDDLDNIVAVPGLDSVVIGPMDLSASLGVLGDMKHPRVMAAMDTIITKTRAAGLSVGAGLGFDPDVVVDMIQRGVQWMHVAGDYQYLVKGIEQATSAIRGRIGERATRAPKA
jgi:2-keto-3-deoxy-L-rhamnonate aldolase RhmA